MLDLPPAEAYTRAAAQPAEHVAAEFNQRRYASTQEQAWLLLAAQALGLGACWLGIHPREDRIRQVKALFDLPATVIPVAAIALGRPGEEKELRTRYDPAKVHHERWSPALAGG